MLIERGETPESRRRRMLLRWGLSEREAEVLALIAAAKTGPEIAILLRISHDTNAQAHQPRSRKAWRRNPHRSGRDGAVGNFVRKRSRVTLNRSGTVTERGPALRRSTADHGSAIVVFPLPRAH